MWQWPGGIFGIFENSSTIPVLPGKNGAGTQSRGSVGGQRVHILAVGH